MEILYGYVAPEVRIFEVEVEKGYAGSGSMGEDLGEDPNVPDIEI